MNQLLIFTSIMFALNDFFNEYYAKLIGLVRKMLRLFIALILPQILFSTDLDIWETYTLLQACYGSHLKYKFR